MGFLFKLLVSSHLSPFLFSLQPFLKGFVLKEFVLKEFVLKESHFVLPLLSQVHPLTARIISSHLWKRVQMLNVEVSDLCVFKVYFYELYLTARKTNPHFWEKGFKF